MKNNALGWGWIGAVFLAAGTLENSAASFSFNGSGDFASGTGTYDLVGNGVSMDVDFGIVNIRFGARFDSGYFPTVEHYVFTRRLDLPAPYQVVYLSQQVAPYHVGYVAGQAQSLSGIIPPTVTWNDWGISDGTQYYFGALSIQVTMETWELNANGELHIAGTVNYRNGPPQNLPSFTVPDSGSTMALILMGLAGLAFTSRRMLSH